MFTGIIEVAGRVVAIKDKGSSREITVSSAISEELKVDQSVSHNGVCLTVTAVEQGTHTVDVVRETLERSNFKELKEGALLNLERSVKADQRLDGHIVQGHVDATGICEGSEDVDGSWMFTFSFPEKYQNLLVDKGSIAINGVSLTLITPTENTFQVTIIPYTYEHTNFKDLNPGDAVNLEFDVLAKYLARHMEMYAGRS